ncbi:hypothetical protein PABG_06680 [Paracoccidioides brasiliensis Pb03]|uniref:Uncharacterized protein n=1 Tax=Paracoccidioides brasiliensis (strain Pb18) TaxID=502780 RepID=C1G2B0_PARBD|nr:uncharacterized protein PADG_02276 [Paracoccidioides brasiliensis Pb18]EEH16593.2 hypothetical protein PABG_06680 [Paracoccidioides brasiliensis Pb03]EEH46126.2 hypothetical protein PADG_02276 [Paracoccidioides brasiliensis Pb18]
MNATPRPRLVPSALQQGELETNAGATGRIYYLLPDILRWQVSSQAGSPLPPLPPPSVPGPQFVSEMENERHDLPAHHDGDVDACISSFPEPANMHRYPLFDNRKGFLGELCRDNHSSQAFCRYTLSNDESLTLTHKSSQRDETCRKGQSVSAMYVLFCAVLLRVHLQR